MRFIAGVCFSLVLCLSTPVAAQREVVARGVSDARRIGDEAALIHMAGQIGAAGVAECLEHASRAGRILCALAARHLEQRWAALPVLATVLRDHDRQVASSAAESMVVILSSMQSADLGEQEPLPDEFESLLRGLRQVAVVPGLSVDIRAQVVIIFGALSRIVGAGLDVPRRALRDPDVAIRRAAVGALMSSPEPDDISAMVEVASNDPDLLVKALASAGVCEATLGAGLSLPAPVEARIRSLLQDARARPSVVIPLIACIARAAPSRTGELRDLASRHPNPATRAAWVAMTSDEE